MKYWTCTLAEDTGFIEKFEGIPFEDKSALKKRLYKPRPFSPKEWSSAATAVFDEEWIEDVDDWSDCDTFTFDLYPVVSPRFKALLETLVGSDEIEFLPVQMRGLQSGRELGVYYIPHFLKSYDCLDHKYIRRTWVARLFRARFPAEARLFIAPDPTHTHLVFRDDVVQAIKRARITGIDFYELELDTDAPRAQVPLGMIFYATVSEQREWLEAVLGQGAYGFVFWQLWLPGEDRIRTRVYQLRGVSDVEKVPWELSEAEAEATLKLAVYLSCPQWRERVRFADVEGELVSGGLGELLELGSLDTVGQGWYGRLELGAQVGSVLLRGGWYLPYGWQDAELGAFEELYRWWDGWADGWSSRRASDVAVRSGRRGDALDEYTVVTVGASRWWLGGGELRAGWGAKPVRLVGRGLRRLR
ncbi:MAG: hypothetical protein KatS3mg019_1593 [Fimbriimonadales bacterium]|nr:MAG: hypothetical protein KatS3mg019_1593 [Fimbriimonadales bacterium]